MKKKNNKIYRFGCWCSLDGKLAEENDRGKRPTERNKK